MLDLARSYPKRHLIHLVPPFRRSSFRGASFFLGSDEKPMKTSIEVSHEAFLFLERGEVMGKGKYVQWLEPENLILLEGWARDGLTDEQIAENMGIRRPTLYDWKKKYSDIADALKRGKQVVDFHVENALLKRALGYEYEEVKYVAELIDEDKYTEIVEYETEKFDEENPNASRAERDLFILSIPRYREVVAERKRKTMAPDTTAAIFWLKNRKPHEWRDKQEIQHSGGLNNTNVDLSSLSVEELRALAKPND